MADRREPHPTIPHLYRELGPPTLGEQMYPYLPKQQSGAEPPTPQPLGKGLLDDVTRQSLSPLGGQAVKEQSK